MSLIAEVFQKIRQLLDKPISSLTHNQIIQLINKQVAPADDILVLFARKYRADLLLDLIAAQPITPEKLQFLLGVLLDKLLQFKTEDACSLWKAILIKQELKGVRQAWTERLLKEALKNSNETLKIEQLELLKENASLLWQWNQGRIFEDFTKNYCKAFTKFNIYLTPFASILYLLFSRAQRVETNLIDNDRRKELLARLIDFLIITKNKQLLQFQNQCLKTCSLILSSKKTSLNDFILLHTCDKMLQQYLWKKPTREEAYACKEATRKVREIIHQENRDKMCRNYQPRQSKPQPPILIEQLIDKTNQYRKNSQLMISQSSLDQDQNSSYLKRGNGNGGGKSMIVSPLKRKNIGVTDLDELVQSCFRTTSDKSFKARQQQSNEWANQIQASMNASTITLEEDKDFQQISNLIELAYQYKFGLQYKQ